MNELGVSLALVGLWGWVGAMLVFIFRTFPAKGEFKARQATIWGGVSLLFFCAWITGMLVA